MLEKVRSLRLNVRVGALMVIALGVILLVWPGAVITTITRGIGLIIAIIGVFQFLGKLSSRVNRSSGMLVGALIAGVGFWIIFHPERTAGLIPVIIGVVLVVHGVQNISLAFIGKGYGMERWYVYLIGGLLNLLCGVICVAYAFGVVELGVRILGIMLLYDGIASMLTVTRLNRYEQDYIDAEYREL